MREFATNRDTHTLATDFLNEHAQLIAKREKLVSMVNGIKKLSLKK